MGVKHLGRIFITRQSFERFFWRVGRLAKVVAPTCSLDCKVHIVKVPIKDVRISEPETDDASPLLGKAKRGLKYKMFMQGEMIKTTAL